MDQIKFPQFYTPRIYQRDMHKLWKEKKYGVVVAHRQAGKDVAMFFDTLIQGYSRPKSLHYYISTSKPNIKDIIWDKVYDINTPEYEGNVRLIHDNLPPEVGVAKDTNKEIHYVNGSMLACKGYYDSNGGVGTGADSYNITELSLFNRHDPLDYLQQAIDGREHRKLRVASTPRGKGNNPLWRLIKSMENDPNFGMMTLTIDDTGMFTEEQIEIIKDRYYRKFGNYRLFNQEYYCSFEEVNAALVYGDNLKLIRKENRITKINVSPEHPVILSYDLARKGDKTAIIAFQYYNGKLFIIDEYQGSQRAPKEHTAELESKPWWRYVRYAIMPWDADNDYSTKSTLDEHIEAYPMIRFEKLQKHSKNFGVDKVRTQLANTIFNEATTRIIIDCMENWEYKYSEMLGDNIDFQHNEYSHMMDALRYACVGIHQAGIIGLSFEIKQYAPAEVEYYQGV
jgi:hypothetical protein